MLSLPKILLLVVIAGAMLFLGKLFRERGHGSKDNNTTENEESTRDDKTASAVDMINCEVCGDYIEPATFGCEHADCPYR